jgi:hypothetical protein
MSKSSDRSTVRFLRMSSSFELPRHGRTVREARAAAAAGTSKRISTRQRNRSVQRVLYTCGVESGCPGAQIRRLQNRLGVTKHLPSPELAYSKPTLCENSSKRKKSSLVGPISHEHISAYSKFTRRKKVMIACVGSRTPRVEAVVAKKVALLQIDAIAPDYLCFAHTNQRLRRFGRR